MENQFKRSTFVLQREWWDAISTIEDPAKQLAALDAIMLYAFEGKATYCEMGGLDPDEVYKKIDSDWERYTKSASYKRKMRRMQ